MDARFVESLAQVLKHEDWPTDILQRELRINAIRDAQGKAEVVKIEFLRPGSLFQIFMGSLSTPRSERALWVNLRAVSNGEEKETACALIEDFLVRHQVAGVVCEAALPQSSAIASGAMVNVAQRSQLCNL